jgi:hypothetical protein
MAKGGKTGDVTLFIRGLGDVSDRGISNSDDLTNLFTGFTLTGASDHSISSFSLTINGVECTVTDTDIYGSIATLEITSADEESDGALAYTPNARKSLASASFLLMDDTI